MTPLSDLESHKVNMPGLLTLSPPQSSLSHSLHSLRWLQGPQHQSWCLTVQFTFSWVHTHVLLQSIHLYCRSRIETFYKVCFAPNSRFISQICCFMIHMTRLDFPGKHRILPQKRSLENKLFKKKKKKTGTVANSFETTACLPSFNRVDFPQKSLWEAKKKKHF